MRFYTVRDFVQFKKLHSKILSLPAERRTPSLRKLVSCMSRPSEQGVTIMKRGNKVGFSGITYCHSWTCPSCAPYKMNKIKCDIENAFKLMKERGYICCMMTFSIPHTRIFIKNSNNINTNMDQRREMLTLSDTLYILQRTFNKFGNSGSLKKFRGTDFQSFLIYEINWGSFNGWHPHIHALYWLKPEQFKIFTSKEDAFNKIWTKNVKKVINEMSWWTETKRSNFINFIDYLKTHKPRNSVYFSKNDSGAIREFTAENYFWSGENEVADLMLKKGRNGHLTIWQILEKATSETSESNFYFDLYCEATEATRGLQQHRFKRGFLAEIKNFEKGNPKETTEKKSAEPVEEIICWLSQKQWNYLRYIHHCYNLEIILSSFSLYNNAFELITEFCEAFGVGPPLKKPPFDLYHKAA